MSGAICLQGPHQLAVKSTRTGTSELRTSSSKLRSLTVLTVSFAMGASLSMNPMNNERCVLYTQLSMIEEPVNRQRRDRKSTRLNSSHVRISYAVFCLKKKTKKKG